MNGPAPSSKCMEWLKVLIGGKAVGSWKSPSYFHESGVITEEIDDWLSEFLCSSVCTCDW